VLSRSKSPACRNGQTGTFNSWDRRYRLHPQQKEIEMPVPSILVFDIFERVFGNKAIPA
jgi:hypothetical protein